MTESITAWHWMRDDRKLRFTPHTRVEPGVELQAEGPLDLGANGMHGSLRVLDALRYAPGFTVARTVHGGEIIYGADRLCSRTRTAHWIIDAHELVLDWLCLIVDRSLTSEQDAGRDPDSRLWNVLTTLRRYLNGEASITEVRNTTYAAAFAANAADAAVHAAAHATYATYREANAAFAAVSAAANAARATAYAARAAANSTDAASNAARAAANAARVVTHADTAGEWLWMNSELENRIFAARERQREQEQGTENESAAYDAEHAHRD